MTKGVISDGVREDAFFTLFDEPAPIDRRFLMATTGALAALGVVAGAALARAQRPAGAGVWYQGAVRDWVGIIETSPYPALRLVMNGRPMRALLATQGKCAVDARLDPFVGAAARVTGSLIKRDDYVMIAVADGPEWIGPSNPPPKRPDLPVDRPLADGRFRGEILDTKCWFGAMRPARGKTHKACAALCIRGGLPPAFFITAPDGRTRSLLLTDERRRPMPMSILPYVADPVSLEGRLIDVDNLAEFRADPSSIRRV